MDIYVQSTIGTCGEFMVDGKEFETSVVISPLKITQKENDQVLQVNSGCNMWKACQNPRCHFSLVAHGGDNRK